MSRSLNPFVALYPDDAYCIQEVLASNKIQQLDENMIAENAQLKQENENVMKRYFGKYNEVNFDKENQSDTAPTELLESDDNDRRMDCDWYSDTSSTNDSDDEFTDYEAEYAAMSLPLTLAQNGLEYEDCKSNGMKYRCTGTCSKQHKGCLKECIHFERKDIDHVCICWKCSAKESEVASKIEIPNVLVDKERVTDIAENMTSTRQNTNSMT